MDMVTIRVLVSDFSGLQHQLHLPIGTSCMNSVCMKEMQTLLHLASALRKSSTMSTLAIKISL